MWIIQTGVSLELVSDLWVLLPSWQVPNCGIKVWKWSKSQKVLYCPVTFSPGEAELGDALLGMTNTKAVMAEYIFQRWVLFCHVTLPPSTKRCSLFPHPLEPGQPLFLLWQSDAVQFPGMALHWPSSFCFLPLGSQTPCNENTYPETTMLREPSPLCERCRRLRQVVGRKRSRGMLRRLGSGAFSPRCPGCHHT